MPAFICKTCGIQYPESEAPPEKCLICEDERQYVPPSGQQWTTLEALQADHHNEFYEVEPGITAIHTTPDFSISQRAHLIQTPGGNVLWETISLIDAATVAEVQQRGGLRAIAISHPHFYDTMVEWSHAFGNIPIYLHADNRKWVMRPDPVVHFWEGETFDLGDGLTIIRCGGHFPGSSVLHWRDGAAGKGSLLTGDTMMVVADQHVSFMFSYPNMIPLPPSVVRRIVAAVELFEFDRLHSSWAGKVIPANAKAVVRRSMERYIAHVTERVGVV